MCLGIPGRIISVDDAARKLVTVEMRGARQQVNIGCIVDEAHPVEACIGEWVIMHLGFAMSRVSAPEAAAILQILNELVEAQAGRADAQPPYAA